MDGELEEFRKQVLVQAVEKYGENDINRGFVSVAGDLLEDAEELVDFMPCPFRGTGARRRSLGIDGYAFDDADGSLRVVIASVGGESAPATVTQTSAKTEFAKLTAFIEEALAGNDDYLPVAEDPAADFADLLRVHRHNIARFRLYLITDGVLSDRIRDWPEGTIDEILVEFHIWDIGRLFSTVSSRSGREALRVDFGEIVDGGIPCLHASLNQSRYSGYLCVLPGETLGLIYDTYGSRLLEGNVRSFLGKTGKVNKSMRETILKNPEMFFAFNNGIAATATSVEVETTPDGPRLISANDLQIVNGGQTTASLAFARRKDGADLSGVFVQMKLSVVSEELSGELIPKISEYANKQNKVSDSDLFSNHEYHRKMEELSRRLKAPPRPDSQRGTSWFYERAKGQYRIETAKMSPAEKARFEAENPKNQLLTKTDLAKIENSWRALPHEVSKGAQKNFDAFSKYVVSEWATRPLDFNDEYFKTVVAHAIVFKELERLVPQQKEWYDGGYRANVVTYSIAKLVHMVEERGNGSILNCQSIWRQQAISDALAEQLKLVARVMYDVITNPEQGLENVTEWCKKELAWQRAKERPVALLPSFLSELAPVAEVERIERNARDVARIDRGIAAVTAVIRYKTSEWRQAREWGLSKKLLTPKDEQLLVLASTAGRVPTERQAEAILEIRAKLAIEGYSPQTS